MDQAADRTEREYRLAFLCWVMGERRRARLDQFITEQEQENGSDQHFTTQSEIPQLTLMTISQTPGFKADLRSRLQAMWRELDGDWKQGVASLGASLLWWKGVGPLGADVGIEMGGWPGMVAALVIIFMPLALAGVSSVYSYRSLVRDIRSFFVG